MPDWFSQFEQPKPKADPWFDQFGKKEDKDHIDPLPKDEGLFTKIKNKIKGDDNYGMDVSKHRPLNVDDKGNINTGDEPNDNIFGRLVNKGASKLADIIDDPNKADRGKVLPFIAGSVQGLGSLIGGGLDPRSVAIKPVPRIDPAKVEAGLNATKTAYKDIAAFQPKQPLGLPAIGESSPPSPGSLPNFYNGPAGTTIANKTYPLDTSPVQPGLRDIPPVLSPKGEVLPNPGGTVLPREMGEITQLPAIDAANRGTTLGTIAKIHTDDMQSVLGGLEKAKTSPTDITPETSPQVPQDYTPNPAAMDPRVESPLPKPDARSFGAPREKNQLPDIKNGPDDLGAIDEVPGNTNPKTEPKRTATPKVTDKDTLPAPGQARPSKDVSAIRAELGSVDKTLESRPETKPIVDAIVGANDAKMSWIATTERELAQYTKGLSPKDATALGRILDKGVIEGVDNPDLVQRANAIREVLDKIHSELPEKLPNDKNLGYIENYLTHIEKQEPDLRDGMRQMWDYHLGRTKNIINDPLGTIKRAFSTPELSQAEDGIGDMYQKGSGNPNSNFVKNRSGKLEDIELNANRVLPAYVESIAKLKFDKPAIEQAKLAISKMGDTVSDGSASRIKDLAKWYVTNYTKYDALPGLSKSWNSLTDSIARTTSRSMLGFNTGLQTLHLARIPANLFPELEGKYLAQGLKAVTNAPIESYKEAVKLGLLQNEIRPIQFKTATQKLDSVLQFGNVADYLDRSIGYHGFKAKFLDQGLNDADATAAALRMSKRASLVTDAARPIKAFNPEPGFVGTIAKLSMQFKQVPIRIIEQYASIAANAAKNPAAAARMVTGVGLAVGAYEAGARTFHLSSRSFMTDIAGASGTEVKKIYSHLVQGDLEGALKETTRWIVPGGLSLHRQIQNGPSFIEPGDKSKVPSRLSMPRQKKDDPLF